MEQMTTLIPELIGLLGPFAPIGALAVLVVVAGFYAYKMGKMSVNNNNRAESNQAHNAIIELTSTMNTKLDKTNDSITDFKETVYKKFDDQKTELHQVAIDVAVLKEQNKVQKE